MKKINDVQGYLLKNWEGVMKIKEEMESLQKLIDELCDEICGELLNRSWWSNEFVKPEYRWNNIFFWKDKSWCLGKGDYENVELYVGRFKLDELLGYGENGCYAGVWTEPLKKLGTDKKEKFHRVFDSNSKGIQKSLSQEFKVIKDPEAVFCYELGYTDDQYIEFLKSGHFTEMILKHFDNLSQFIEPIDRTLAEVLGKKRVKK